MYKAVTALGMWNSLTSYTRKTGARKKVEINNRNEKVAWKTIMQTQENRKKRAYISQKA